VLWLVACAVFGYMSSRYSSSGQPGDLAVALFAMLAALAFRITNACESLYERLSAHPRLPAEQIAEQQLKDRDALIEKAASTLEAAAKRFIKHGHAADALDTSNAAKALRQQAGLEG
jgi:hypothetical protein